MHLFIFLIPPTLLLLTSIFASLTTGYYNTLPLGLIGVASVISSYYLSNKNNTKNIFSHLTISLIALYLFTLFLAGKNEKIEFVTFSNKLQIIDDNNKIFDLNSKGKIKIIDLWSTKCGVCIKNFPDYEKQHLRYKNDTLVNFYSLNLPLKGDNLNQVKKITEMYSFSKLYASNINSWNLMDVKGVPLLIIIDTEGKIRYRGRMNTNDFLPLNNFNRIIDKLKNEL